MNAYHRARHAADPDARRDATRRHYARNQEQMRERNRRRYADPAQAARKRATTAAWSVANPDRTRESMRGVYARRRALIEAGGVTPEQWAAVLAFYDDACAYCGARQAVMEQDHVVPLARGGAHDQGNVVPACTPCNRAKSNRLLAEWFGFAEAGR